MIDFYFSFMRGCLMYAVKSVEKREIFFQQRNLVYARKNGNPMKLKLNTIVPGYSFHLYDVRL